ncbi:MAG: allophanate hydrolase subunit 1, partial [Ilumatobacteraceae bacterium]
MNLVAFGPHAVLVECGSLAGAVSVAARLRTPPLDGVDDVVAAARTVLIRGLQGWVEIAVLVEERLRGWTPETEVVATRPTVQIRVRYDGEDLASVAAASGLTVAAVVDLHATARYTVAFCGFAPGFAYLVGLPAALVLPRRRTPRTVVPAGSVAIAGEFSAVYPTPSPGGWHLLGHTSQTMFDPRDEPPALLTPGAGVRFEAT